MKKINVLNKQTAQLIAAGEVVERPASVLKELLENSIDSGATRITAEIKCGGIKFIKVSDNGSGIYRDDVKNAFLRHATSKLKNAEDLNEISSLGFRGEALASICSVSRVEVITKSKEEPEGTHFYIDAGVSGKIEDYGCSNGTSIIVRDMFYNTPARMKFLKKDVAEANNCALVVDKLALSHPEISFKFIREGKEVLYTPGDKKISSAIYSVYGKDFFDGMIPVDYELNCVKITGFIGKPTCSKSSRSMQNFFVNKRFVKSKVGSAALEEGFKNSVMVGKFPYCVLYIDVPPEMVDVNVHPAKTEIKFANEKSVFEAVYYAVKSALMFVNNSSGFGGASASMRMSDSFSLFDIKPTSTKQNNLKTNEQSNISKSAVKNFSVDKNEKIENIVQPNFRGIQKKEVITSKPYVSSDDEKVVSKEMNFNKIESVGKVYPEKFEKSKEFYVSSQSKKDSVNSSESVSNESQDTEKSFSLLKNSLGNDIKIIGEIFDCYIIAQYQKEMILIDKHAAHERIIFEKLKNNGGGKESQILLEPCIVTMEKDEYSAIVENLDIISKIGYEINDFGSGSVIVRSAPMYMDIEEIPNSVCEIANYIKDNKKCLDTKRLDWLYHNIACRCAIKGGKGSSPEEICCLVQTLLDNPNIKYCPHGRPVFVPITKKFIEKQFGRM